MLALQADQGNHIIRTIDTTTGAVQTLAGRQGTSAPFADGVGSTATFNLPLGIAFTSPDALAVVVGLQMGIA
jgi:hypothetical protein